MLNWIAVMLIIYISLMILVYLGDYIIIKTHLKYYKPITAEMYQLAAPYTLEVKMAIAFRSACILIASSHTFLNIKSFYFL